MKIVLISDHEIPPAFQAASVSKHHEFSRVPTTSWGQALKTLAKSSLVYLDWSSISAETGYKICKALATRGEWAWGIYDPEARFDDPSEVFFSGGSDYLGPQAGNLDTTRLNKILDYYYSWAEPDDEAPVNQTVAWSWDTAVEGQEYPFVFFLVQVAEGEILRKKIGEVRFNQLKEDLKTWLTSACNEIGGQLWMSVDTAFLALFPSSGSTSSMMTLGMKMLVNSAVLSVESFRLDTFLQFKIGAHPGSTAYRRPGQTGTVISDSVNSIFHLVQKYASAGSFYLTKEALDFCPAGLKDLFVLEGVYEGRQIWRSKRFL